MCVMHHLEIKSLLQSDTAGMGPSFKRVAAVAKMTRCDYQKMAQPRRSRYGALVTLDGTAAERIAAVTTVDPVRVIEPVSKLDSSRVLTEAGIAP
jgi:hypothetical protein